MLIERMRKRLAADTKFIEPCLPSPADKPPSGSSQFLHHDPVALNLVQLELDRCGSFGRFRIVGFDRTEDFPLGAQQDYAPAALHPACELRGAVFLAGAAGRHGL
jgi:hypothetical protein